MPTLPSAIMVVLNHFAPLFSERTWDWVPVLVIGALLTPGRRTVTRVLQVMGQGQDRQYQKYHRVMNRAVWSSLAVSQVLLGLIVTAFVATGGAVVLGADETLERRRGAKISGVGCFRDAARSSHKHKVKSFGLRWVSLMVLVRVPWSARVWALPFLTVLAPNRATDATAHHRHKTSLDWIRQMITQVRRWLPQRSLVLVVDGGLAALHLGQRCAHLGVTYVTRLQMNARLFDLPPSPTPRQRGRPRVVGERQLKPEARLTDPHTGWQTAPVRWYGGHPHLITWTSGVALWYTCGRPPLLGRWVLLRAPAPHLAPAILFCTDPNTAPEQIIAWFVMRWSLEVTFQETRAHLGFNTQRHWNPQAVARTTPAILGLFSLVSLLAHRHLADTACPIHATAWYTKRQATFSDLLALVRHDLWTTLIFPRTLVPPRSVEIPVEVRDLWLETLSLIA